MTRLLLVAAVIALLLWMVRRMVLRGARGRPRAGRGGTRAGKLGPPDHLVCGECGAEFDAEKYAWICPHCRK